MLDWLLRGTAAVLSGAAAVLLVAPAVAQESFPSRPVRIVLPYGPAGGTDQLARGFADALSKALAQPVVVDNRPGANGLLAAENVLRSPADGYTLYFPSDGQLVINPHLYRTITYDTEKDFLPVSLLGKVDFLIVFSPQVGLNSMRELIERARASPGKLTYALPGIGSPHHLLTERIKLATGTDILQVPYQQTPAAVVDVTEGRVDMMVVGTPPSIGLVNAGKLKALAMGGERRNRLLPDVPTLAEAGVPNVVGYAWWGLVAPRGTSQDRVKKLEQESIKAVRAPELVERMAKVGIEIVGSTADEFAGLIRRDFAGYGDVIRKLGLPKQ